MKLMSIVTLALLVFSANSFAQEATREDFNEFSRLMAGRWIADITWVEDWPGVGKKGDKATGYFDVKQEADGHVLVGRHYAGKGAGIWMVAYHAADKKITGTYADVSGISQMTYYKKNGKWMEDVKGSLSDGRRNQASSTITYSENGNKMVLVGTGTTDGKKQDKRHDVYRRITTSK